MATVQALAQVRVVAQTTLINATGSLSMPGDFNNTIAIGISYGKYLSTLNQTQLQCLDYIEVPFELLNFDKDILNTMPDKPLILHCASLSLAGYTLPSENTRKLIAEFADTINTPWIGEHLSYILADKIDDNYYEPYSDEPYNIGYTVNPVMNELSVQNTVSNLRFQQSFFKKPLIIENSPLYFKLQASTMSQAEFINKVCDEADIGMLLDLTHLYISSQNFNFDPKKELKKLPLHRVKEIHLSGVAYSSGLHWDNHASHAPKIIFELLEIALKNSKPKAITFEYNWTPKIAWAELNKEIDQVRNTVENWGKS